MSTKPTLPKQTGFTPSETAGAAGKVQHLGKSVTGFTIVELLIATAVFSVVLLLVTTGMLQIARTYYKGINTAKTQEAARTIMDEVSRSIQFGGGVVTTTIATASDGSEGFCIGDRRYSYIIDRQLVDGPPTLEQSNNVLVVDTVTGCSATAAQDVTGGSITPTSRELLSSQMRLADFTVVSAGDDLWAVNVRVVYGDLDLSSGGSCSGGAGGQFCAASELRTIVKKRVK